MELFSTSGSGRRDTEFLFHKGNRHDLLFLRNRILPFCDLTCLGTQAADMVIKLTCVDMMFFAPGFIRKTTGTAFMDELLKMIAEWR